MIIKNPINQELSIQYQGTKYSIPSLGILHTEDESLVKFWKSIHSFIQIESAETVVTVKETKPIEIEIPEIVEEEVVSEVTETTTEEEVTSEDNLE